MDGRAYLDKFVSDRIRNTGGLDKLTSVDHAEIRGVATGLLAASTLSKQDMVRILANLQHSDTRSGSAHTSSDGQPSLSRDHWSMDPDYSQDRERSSALVASTSGEPRPIRVVSLIGRPQREDIDFMLISLEIWSSLIALRIAYHATQLSSAEILSNHHTWNASDDTGIQYKERSSDAGDSHGFIVATRILEPGPMPHASTLKVVAPHDENPTRTFDLPLR